MIKTNSPVLIFRRIKPYIKGLAAGLITAAVMTAVSALIFTAAKAPDGADVILSYITLGCSCLVCGLFTGGGKGKNGFIWGTAGGGMIFALCCIVSAITGSIDGSLFAAKLCTALITGCAGGIVGVNIAGA